MERNEVSTGPDIASCPVCQGQLPPYNGERHLAFCQRPAHWAIAAGVLLDSVRPSL